MRTYTPSELYHLQQNVSYGQEGEAGYVGSHEAGWAHANHFCGQQNKVAIVQHFEGGGSGYRCVDPILLEENGGEKAQEDRAEKERSLILTYAVAFVAIGGVAWFLLPNPLGR